MRVSIFSRGIVRKLEAEQRRNGASSVGCSWRPLSTWCHTKPRAWTAPQGKACLKAKRQPFFYFHIQIHKKLGEIGDSLLFSPFWGADCPYLPGGQEKKEVSLLKPHDSHNWAQSSGERCCSGSGSTCLYRGPGGHQHHPLHTPSSSCPISNKKEYCFARFFPGSF